MSRSLRILSVAVYSCSAVICAAQQQQQPPPARQLEQRGIVREGGPPKKVTATMVPRGYALIIGITKYPKLSAENNMLQFPERDAEAMHDILIKQEGGNFAPENVHKLIGEKATLANITKELEQWLPSVAKENDRVIIYFAGHGFVQDSKGYLAPYDTDLDRLSETAYPMKRLGEVVGTKIAARWKVLLTDACHSGAITPETTEAVNQNLANVDKNILSFTASRKRESSYEDPKLGGGLFTYFTVKALEGHADRNRDGAVTADELIAYVQSHVRDYALERSRQQNPTENGDFDSNLILAFSPKVASEPGDTPKLSDGVLLVESTKEGVQFLLDGKVMGVVNPGKALSFPGISAGWHTVQGVKDGYDPDGPRRILVAPGVETPVSLRIQFRKVRKGAALNHFKDGLKLYNKGGNDELKQAVAEFQKALAEDADYEEAALYLGRTYQVLGDTEQALKNLELAVKLQPAWVEGRLSLGSMLLDMGNTTDSIEHLRQAVSLDPKNSLARSHMAQAYRMTGTYDKAIDEAREAIKLDKSNAQAQLWLGDSLRAQKQWDEARDAYLQYVLLTDFDASVPEKIGFYFLGNPFTSAFSKKRATQRQVYKDQRNIGFFGLCDCEQRLGHLNKAEQYCLRALSYDPNDPFSYFKLGRIGLDRFNQSTKKENLLEAKANFQKMLSLNPDLEESSYAKKYLEAIEATLNKLARR
ncbi:MAG: caspase family protein [Bryobacterales bacterium]|nr:caspase family protein [Bryobacterales bacterium]